MPNLTEKEAASIVTEQSDGTDIARNDYVLGSQITAETLNVEEGPNKGQSVALWLAGSPAGQALLSHGNPSLRSQIDTETLNQVIDTETLNQVIEEGKYKGTSVAECPAEWSAPETHEVSANAAAEDDEASRSPSRNHAETPLERLVVMSKEIPKEVVSSPPRENTGEASEIPGAQNNDVESVSIHNFGFWSSSNLESSKKDTEYRLEATLLDISRLTEKEATTTSSLETGVARDILKRKITTTNSRKYP